MPITKNINPIGTMTIGFPILMCKQVNASAQNKIRTIYINRSFAVDNIVFILITRYVLFSIGMLLILRIYGVFAKFGKLWSSRYNYAEA